MATAAGIESVAVGYADSNIDPGFDLDPVGPFLEIVKDRPVVSGKNGVYCGVKVPNNALLPDEDEGVYLALSYDAAKFVLSNDDIFSSAQANEFALAKTIGRGINIMDNPDHDRYRRLVAPAFMHRAITTDAARIIRPRIEAVLDPIVQKGQADLMSEFIMRFPFSVIATYLNIPMNLEHVLHKYMLASLLIHSKPEEAMAVKSSMNDLIFGIIENERTSPTEGLVNQLVNTTVDGEKLSDDEIANFMRLLAAAGIDTTARGMGSLIWHLLENPDQFEMLRSDHSLVEKAAWEAVRLTPPGSALVRRALRDVDVCGVTIPAGHYIYIMLGVANQDPSRWDEPTKFKIDRPKKPFLSFGAGMHTCIGMSLALSEMHVAMELVLDRLPGLRKDESAWPDARLRGFQVRSPDALPVKWDV